MTEAWFPIELMVYVIGGRTFGYVGLPGALGQAQGFELVRGVASAVCASLFKHRSSHLVG